MPTVAYRVDCVVIGAGVVGLAVARALALLGREVLLLDSEGAIGTQTSARNSEVLHAGLYYPPGSLKARLCVRGNALLVDYCAARHIGHQRCGKFVVATHPQQLEALKALQHRGLANGVHDLVWLDAPSARALEPGLACEAALHSPSTGIIDSHGLMQALLADFEHAGGSLVLNSAIERMECAGEAIELVAKDGTLLRANTVVNSAGLQALALATRCAGLAPEHVPTPYFAKGNYFSLAGRSPFSRLIYLCRNLVARACT